MAPGSRGSKAAHLQDHAWFVAFAPADAPRIAVTVLVEHGGHGGSTAAPIAKRVIEMYLGESAESDGDPTVARRGAVERSSAGAPG
jgi:cell division protein FtsI/penicillin-binding protein 2